jgi:hypothetical protein
LAQKKSAGGKLRLPLCVRVTSALCEAAMAAFAKSWRQNEQMFGAE